MTATRPISEGTLRRGWLAKTGLLLLSALPVVGGVLRLGADPDGTLPLERIDLACEHAS